MPSTTMKQFNINNAQRFIDDLTTIPHYLFVGKHLPYIPDDSSISLPNTSIKTFTDVYDNMIFGKRIKSQDVIAVAQRFDWEADLVFDEYSDIDGDLFNKKFYCVVTDGNTRYVYKCLYNNGNTKSITEPSGTDILPFETPSDGYIWKYLYKITDANWQKFATDTSIPIIPDANTTNGAISGSIDVIKVNDPGKGYNNYFSGAFRAQDIRVSGEDEIYAILETASSYNDFYNNCIIKITSGSGINQYRKIISYVIADSKKKIRLDSKFDIVPSPTDTYEIYPAVAVYGDGNQSANCIARALIDANAGNSVSKVDILNVGAGYRHATASVISENIVGVTSNATFTVSMPPIGGHGSNVINELGSSKVEISIKLNQDESGYVTSENEFRNVGILRQPLFDNVSVKILSTNNIGQYIVGEPILQYRDIDLSGTVDVVAANSTIISSDIDFRYAVNINDYVLISDSRVNHVSKIQSITNSSQIILSNAPTWANTDCSISIIDSLAEAKVLNITTGVLSLTNLSDKIYSNYDKLVGLTTSATSVIDRSANLVISINGKDVNGFDTFNQLYSFIGTQTSSPGTFEQDEKIYDDIISSGPEQPTAYVHSYVSGNTNDIIYATNINNIFTVGNDIIGENSDAVFEISNKYKGDLVVGSGELLYLENIAPITRADNKSEKIKIILEL